MAKDKESDTEKSNDDIKEKKPSKKKSSSKTEEKKVETAKTTKIDPISEPLDNTPGNQSETKPKRGRPRKIPGDENKSKPQVIDKIQEDNNNNNNNNNNEDEKKPRKKKSTKKSQEETIGLDKFIINNDNAATKNDEELPAARSVAKKTKKVKEDIEVIPDPQIDSDKQKEGLDSEKSVENDSVIKGTGISVEEDESLNDLFSFDDSDFTEKTDKNVTSKNYYDVSEIISIDTPISDKKKKPKKKEHGGNESSDKFNILDPDQPDDEKPTSEIPTQDTQTMQESTSQKQRASSKEEFTDKENVELKRETSKARGKGKGKDEESSSKFQSKDTKPTRKEKKSNPLDTKDENFIVYTDEDATNSQDPKKKKTSQEDMEDLSKTQEEPFEIDFRSPGTQQSEAQFSDAFNFDDDFEETKSPSKKETLKKKTANQPSIVTIEQVDTPIESSKEKDEETSAKIKETSNMDENDDDLDFEEIESEPMMDIHGLNGGDGFIDGDLLQGNLLNGNITEDSHDEDEHGDTDEDKSDEEDDQFFGDDFAYKESTDEIKGWELQLTYIPEEFYSNMDVILSFDNEKPYNSGQGILFFWLATRVRSKYDISYIDKFISDIFPDVPISKFQPAKITLGFTRNWIGFRQNKPTMLCTIRHVVGKYILPEHLIIPFTLLETSKRCSDSIKSYIYATKLALDLVAAKKIFPTVVNAPAIITDDSDRGNTEKEEEDDEQKNGDGFIVRWRLLIRELSDLNRFTYLINTCPLSSFNLPINLEIIGKKSRTREFWHPAYLFGTYMDVVANVLVWKSQKNSRYEKIANYKEIHGYKMFSREKIEWLKTTTNKSEKEIQEMNLSWHMKYLMSAVRPRYLIKQLDLSDAVNITGMNSWIYPLMANDPHNCFILGLQINFPKRKQNGNAKKSTQRHQVSASTNDWFIDFQYVPIESSSKSLPMRIFWDGLEKIRSRGAFRSLVFVRPKLIEEIMLSLSHLSHIFPYFWDKYSQTNRPSVIRLKNEHILDLMEKIDEFKKAGYLIRFPKEFDLSGKSRVTTKLMIQPQQREKGKPKLTATMGPAIGMDTLLEFKWNIYIGDESISIDEFEEIAKQGQRLIQWKGKWILLEKEDLEAIKNVIKQKPQGTINQIEAISMALKKTVFLDIKDKKFGPYEVELDQDFREIINRIMERDNFTEVETPGIIKGELRNYQRKGLTWLKNMSELGLGIILADDMGLGKTLQVISFIALNYEENNNVLNPTLVVCPTSIMGNWRKEIDRFAPVLSQYIEIHYGIKRTQELADFLLVIKEHPLVICSYETMKRDIDMLKNVYWDCIILDESQNIKNPSTKRTKAVYELRAKFKICLSGTPIENNLNELWSVFNFINPMLLGLQSHFRKNFILPIEKLKDREVANQLKKIIAPFMLRRKKSDKSIIQDLPEKTETIITTNLTNEQGILYKQFVDEAFRTMEFQKVNKLKKTAAVLRLITQLKLICNHPSLVLKEKVTISDVLKTLDEAEDDDSYYNEEEEEDTEIKPDEILGTKDIIATEIENVDETAIMEMDEEDVGEVPETEEIVEKEVIIENKRDLWKYILRSEKLTRTIDMIEEILNSDQKCLIFTQYVKMGKILMQIIESIFDTKVLFLHGQIPGQYREKYVELFQDPESDYKIFILTLKVGGTGLNLTEASYVIHFDRWWNPAVENQATDRAYRIGQTKPVQVYKFMAEGTIEEKINDLIEEKKELTESIVGTRSEKWITDLSDSELKQLFQYGGLQL